MHGMSATLWKISDSEYTYIYIVYILYTCFVVVAVVVVVSRRAREPALSLLVRGKRLWTKDHRKRLYATKFGTSTTYQHPAHTA
jgi:hypothetical protein